MFFLILVALVSATPIEIWLKWFFRKYRISQYQSDQETFSLYIPSAPLEWILIHGLTFGKGFFAVYLANLFYQSNYLNALTCIVALASHNWPFWLKFKNQRQLFVILWGMAAALFPAMALLFPILCIVFSLIFNTYHLGLITSLACCGLILWLFGGLSIWFFTFMLLLAVETMAVFHPEFSALLDEKPITLLDQFKQRHSGNLG